MGKCCIEKCCGEALQGRVVEKCWEGVLLGSVCGGKCCRGVLKECCEGVLWKSGEVL